MEHPPPQNILVVVAAIGRPTATTTAAGIKPTASPISAVLVLD
jgi:hypothetical protein